MFNVSTPGENNDKKCEGTDRSTLTRFFAVPSPESFTYA